MAYTQPTVADFKAYFARDFVYGITDADVKDSDITKAFGQTDINFNEELWATQATYNIGYLLLAAHYLCIDLQMSSQNVSGTYTWMVSSKSVGSVSESYSIPQRMLDNPYFAYLSKTQYGNKYLMLVIPQLSGNISTVLGATLP